MWLCPQGTFGPGRILVNKKTCFASYGSPGLELSIRQSVDNMGISGDLGVESRRGYLGGGGCIGQPGRHLWSVIMNLHNDAGGESTEH